MRRITISILFFASVLFVACGGRSASSSDSDVNPRDTVKVPEGYTGEDSIAGMTLTAYPVTALSPTA